MSRLHGTVKSVQICVALGASLFFVVLATVLHFTSAPTSLPADCGLVFGAVVRGSGQVSPAIQRRTAAAAEQYAKGNLRAIIVSGGIGRPGQLSEANVMKRLAVRLGVPESAVYTEELATSTWENIAFAKDITARIHCKSVVAFSDDYHIARILYSGWLQDTAMTAYPVLAPLPKLVYTRFVLREVLALLAYTVILPVRAH